MAEIDSSLALDGWQKELLENAGAPLHPDLAEYFVRADPDSKLGWDTLKHPLVFAVPYTEAMNYMYNKSYEAKTQALCEYASEGNWGGYVFMHERPYRFNVFESVMHRLDGPEYWELLGSIWSDSENLWQIGYQRIRRLLALHPENRN